MPCPADGTIASGSRARMPRPGGMASMMPSRRRPGQRQERGGGAAAHDLVDAALHVAGAATWSAGRAWHAAAAPGAAPSWCRSPRRRARRRTGPPGRPCRRSGPGSARRARPPAAGCRPTRCRGASSFSRSFRLCTAKSTRRLASASWISFANSPLPPISASERSCTLVPGGADDMLLEHVQAAQHRAEPLQPRQEHPGLHQGERGAAGAHPQRQRPLMRSDPRG